MNTSPLRRQCSHCLEDARISCPGLSTTVVTSPLHRHHPCPRMASQRTLPTRTCTVAAAQGDAVVTSTSEMPARPLSVVKHPALDHSERAATPQRHNRRRKKSLSVFVQEPGTCSIHNSGPRPASIPHLNLTRLWRILEYRHPRHHSLLFRIVRRSFSTIYYYPSPRASPYS